jgi:hypothetical protein
MLGVSLTRGPASGNLPGFRFGFRERFNETVRYDQTPVNSLWRKVA